jgi:hypothetical protein
MAVIKQIPIATAANPDQVDTEIIDRADEEPKSAKQ